MEQDLWVKEPEAVQGPELRHHHNEFQHTLEDLVISLVVQFLLIVVSYQLLSWYRRQRTSDGSDDGVLDVHSLPFALCTFALSVGLAGFLLVPVTIVAHELLENYADKWWVSWLDEDLIPDFWQRIFIASNASLYLIIPFAYFYHETEGFRWRRGVASRLYEASVIFALALVLLLGILYLLWAFLSGTGDSWLSFFPFSHLMLSLLGTCLCLGTSPVGFQILISWSFSLRSPALFRSETRQQYEALDMEAQAIESRIQGLRDHSIHIPRPHTIPGAPPPPIAHGSVMTSVQRKLSSPLSDPDMVSLSFLRTREEAREDEMTRHAVEKLRHELQEIVREREESKLKSSQSPLVRNTAALLLTVVTMTLSLYTILRVLWFLLGFFSLGLLGDSTHKDVHSFIRLLLTGNARGSHWLISLLEVVLVVYFMWSALVGVYHIPIISSIRPRPQDTPVHLVVVNTAIFLLIGSSLPIVLRVLGLTSVDIINYYGTTSFVQQALTITILRIAFLFFATTRLHPIVTMILGVAKETIVMLWGRRWNPVAWGWRFVKRIRSRRQGRPGSLLGDKEKDQ